MDMESYNEETIVALKESYDKELLAVDGETYLSTVKERRRLLEEESL